MQCAMCTCLYLGLLRPTSASKSSEEAPSASMNTRSNFVLIQEKTLNETEAVLSGQKKNDISNSLHPCGVGTSSLVALAGGWENKTSLSLHKS